MNQYTKQSIDFDGLREFRSSLRMFLGLDPLREDKSPSYVRYYAELGIEYEDALLRTRNIPGARV